MPAELRYAIRQLVKAPGFALTAVLTLALGIGANTAIFSVVNAVLRHPAGVDHPEQVAVQHTHYTMFTLDVPDASIPVYAAAAGMHSLVDAAAVEQTSSFNIERDGRAEHVPAAQVSWQWFRIFGASAQRTNEVGVRMALGAQRSDVVRLILGHALVRVAMGLGIGAALAGLIPALRAASVDPVKALRME